MVLFYYIKIGNKYQEKIRLFACQMCHMFSIVTNYNTTQIVKYWTYLYQNHIITDMHQSHYCARCAYNYEDANINANPVCCDMMFIMKVSTSQSMEINHSLILEVVR